MKPFDFKVCRSKLEDHYQKTATVPTSVWSKKAVVDIHQIYTRLSWVKEEQTPAGTTQSELKHYSDLFKANKDGVNPKRILVQGQTGIGKSTFVKKLLVDWLEVNKGAGVEQTAVLRNFELVVAVNLKEVSKCERLTDVIRLSNVFAKEDKYMTEGLINYITNNQEKVLLIFDGYDEYRSGCDSEIYEIFRGNSLRSCCVLITTRISKADELRGGEDLHAEITGFSKVDRQTFMQRFLTHDEVVLLKDEIYKRQLNELAKVPLLLLFFCTLWRKGQSKHFPETKAKLYIDIIQFILNHSYSKQSPRHYVEVTSFTEILSEIGKVALQALLKDDHLFEYSQLSDSVRCDESVFIGLLQITEYSETLRPVGMVSFIHKSIQEFLAAWYVTYKCIPDGNLGEISLKLEECLALENVFQFICGLSEDGALAALRHFKSVRISDPSLDLSKAVPDVENDTDPHGPLSDVTDRQEKFSCLVFDSFDQIESKAELSRACFDCLGEILLHSPIRSPPEHVFLKAKETNSWSLIFAETSQLSVFFSLTVSTLKKSVETLATGSSKILQVAEFLEKFQNFSCKFHCGFFSVLCFHNGLVYFYITHLRLVCDDHFRLFTAFVVPSNSVHSASGPLRLNFLKTLECFRYKTRSMEPLGAAIKVCNHLELIQVYSSNDSVCHLLEEVPNPSSCSLSIGHCTLTSAGAVKLAYLLPRFENATRLVLRLGECSPEAVTSLVTTIKHKTLIKELKLSKINLTSAVAEALGQSLPELSALQTVVISGSDGCNLCLQFPDPLSSLRTLTITGLTEYSAETATKFIGVIKHKTLDEASLNVDNLTSVLAETLAQLLPEISALRELKISDLSECSAEAVTRLVADIKNHNSLKELELSKINMTSAVAEALGQSLAELSALQTLTISGSDGCGLWLREDKRLCLLEDKSLWLREDQSLLLREDKGLLLRTMTITGLTEYSARAVTRIIDAIRHKTLNKVELTVFNLTSDLAEALVQLLPELSALQTLSIRDLTECSDEALTQLVAAIKHKTLEQLELNNINLTLAVVEVLCQSLPELSTLQRLKICGADGCKFYFHCPTESSRFKCVRTLGISGLTEYSAKTVTRVIDAIKHKRIDEMVVFVVNLTSASVEALAQLPELSALRILDIGAVTDRSEEAVTKLVAAIKHVSLEELKLSRIHLSLAVAEALSQLLPELSALRTLCIGALTNCSDEAVTKLVAAIKHLSLVELELSRIPLSSAVAEALGQLLPELSALRTLEISGSDGSNLRHKEIEALFGRFNKPSSLRGLSITHFSARGSLASLAKNLSFFPYLEKLQLSDLDMDEADLFGLLENLKYIPYLGHLYLLDNPLGQVVRLMAPHLFEQNKLEKVYFRRGDLSEEDLNYVQKAFNEKRPQLSIEVVDPGTSISFQL